MSFHVFVVSVLCQSHVNCMKLEGQVGCILVVAKFSVLLLALVYLTSQNGLSSVSISFLKYCPYFL